MKGHATMQHVRAGTISLWQLQAIWRTTGEERLCSSSKCRASRAKLQRKDLVPRLVGEVPGSASCTRETLRLERRGAQSAAEVDGESHTRQVLAHAHAGEDG